jgi:hypothetical protein
MSRQVASAVIGEASLTVVRVRWGPRRRADGADLRLANEIRGTPLDTDVTGSSAYYMRRPLNPRPGELG